MPKVKHTMPQPSRQKGQRSLDLPEWLYRVIPPWVNPTRSQTADVWRRIVAAQPVAVDCREFLISSYLSLDWKIEPKVSDQRDELKEEIKYYTDFISYTGDYYYDEVVEWIGKDLLDIPFGAGAEMGRMGDQPKGRMAWIELLDGGTLFPTHNKKWPVGQMIPQVPMKPVIFPKHAINRVYYSPHTQLKLKGWGVPPPEKIYLALELINRGDVYYANLLLDTPEAGILDLGDMSKTSAEEWVKAFRSMLGGIDPMKIPVLYEHNNKVEFIPFGKPPTELMFDKITAKYASLVAAGYGISLSDIGIQVAASGGETLAGSIRQERKTRRTGFSKFKTKMMAFFNYMLPDELEYKVIDNDEELAVATGRARLANATAMAQYIDLGVFSPQEMRMQAISDGLITISVPEKIPADAKPKEERMGDSDERPALLGKPVPPSGGGQGEVLPRSGLEEEVDRVLNFTDEGLQDMMGSIAIPMAVEVKSALELENGEVAAWQDWHDEILWGDMLEEIPELSRTVLDQSRESLDWVGQLDVTEDDIYEEFFSDLGEHESPIKAKIFDIIQNINKNLKRDIQNAIIAGTRRALVNAKSLDENEIIVDNDAVSYVRRELVKLEKSVIDKFVSRMTEEIREVLEEN
jgi:hypothetical protein